jgi:hypothetical protein
MSWNYYIKEFSNGQPCATNLINYHDSLDHKHKIEDYQSMKLVTDRWQKWIHNINDSMYIFFVSLYHIEAPLSRLEGITGRRLRTVRTTYHVQKLRTSHTITSMRWKDTFWPAEPTPWNNCCIDDISSHYGKETRGRRLATVPTTICQGHRHNMRIR